MSKTINAILAMLLASATAQAGERKGGDIGNGSGDPKAAYSTSQGEAINRSFSLDFLRLTPEQIRERDRKLMPLYKFYSTAKAAQALQTIESTFGTNVYVADTTQKPTLDDKKGVMASIVPYYVTAISSEEWVTCGYYHDSGSPVSSIEHRRDQGDDAALCELGDLQGSGSFFYADNRAIPGRGQVTVSPSYNVFKKVAGGDEFPQVVRAPGVFSLLNYRVNLQYENAWLGMMIQFDTYAAGFYTSTQKSLYESPVLYNFIEAMKATSLKGLDATVAFLSGEVRKGAKSRRNYLNEIKWTDEGKAEPYQVVYPQASAVAPIPQPVIYVSKSATVADLVEMLHQHAPQIYAYNSLFIANQLPSLQELELALENHPEILEAVQRGKAKVDRENLAYALQAAYLRVTYGALTGALAVGIGAAAVVAAPISLAAMLASPFWAPILIQTVVIVSR